MPLPAARRPSQAGAPQHLSPVGAQRLFTGDSYSEQLEAAQVHVRPRVRLALALVRLPTQPCVRRVGGGRWLEAGGRPSAHWVARCVCPCPTSAQHRWVARVPEVGSSCGPITAPQPKASGE